MKQLRTGLSPFSNSAAAALLCLTVFSLEPIGGPAGLEFSIPGRAGHFGKFPLSFEVNLGQADRQAQFLTRGLGYGLFLTESGAVLSLRDEAALTRSIRLGVNGANRVSTITPEGPLPGKSNYFLSDDPDDWITGVPHYSKVRYEEVYPGIDLVYYGNRGQIEFDFVVSPGADPAQIELGLEGVRLIEKAGDDIYVAGTTSSGDFPVNDSYQNPHTGGYDVFLAKIFPRVISLSVQGGTSQSTPVDSSFTELLLVKVEDDQGNGMPGLEVTFSGPRTGPGALFENGQAMVSTPTDQDGSVDVLDIVALLSHFLGKDSLPPC